MHLMNVIICLRKIKAYAKESDIGEDPTLPLWDILDDPSSPLLDKFSDPSSPLLDIVFRTH